MENRLNQRSRVMQTFGQRSDGKSSNISKFGLKYKVGCELSILDPTLQKMWDSMTAENPNPNFLIVSFSDPQSQKHTRDDEFVTALAATAFSIYSLEEAGLLDMKKMRGSPNFSRKATVRGKQENISRQPSHGESSVKRSFGQQENRKTESAFLVRNPSGISPAKSPAPATGYQKQKGIPMHHSKDANAKAEAWEKAKIERIQKRYEKIKFKILSWEGEKRIQAKLHMERKKTEFDNKRAIEIQHYKKMIERIDMIAQRAIAEMEEQRRKEELEVKEKAKKVRKTGRVPQVTCFCFKSS